MKTASSGGEKAPPPFPYRLFFSPADHNISRETAILKPTLSSREGAFRSAERTSTDSQVRPPFILSIVPSSAAWAWAERNTLDRIGHFWQPDLPGAGAEVSFQGALLLRLTIAVDPPTVGPRIAT